METRLQSAVLFVLYQLSLLAGIALLPLALLVRKAGLTLPVHRLVERTADAYESTESTA